MNTQPKNKEKYKNIKLIKMLKDNTKIFILTKEKVIE